MKKFDYIVIQAPMISELGLKGNSLLLFAMIHGFSKDGKNRFRASLDEMAEWLITSKGAVSSTLKALEKSGYIIKHDVKDGNREVDVLPYQPIEKAFLNNFFVLYTEDLIPNQYYIDVRVQMGRETKFYKEALRFKIVSNVTTTKVNRAKIIGTLLKCFV